MQLPPSTAEAHPALQDASPSGPSGTSLASRLWSIVRSEWFLVAVGSVLLAVVMTWPLAARLDSAVTHDGSDPVEYSWILSWPGHILFDDPGKLWQGNVFYPEADSLAFTDSGLGYLPASLIGSGPTSAIIRFNLLFLFAFALSFAGAYALVRQLGARWPGALLAGVVWAYAPWRFAQAGHITVISTGGIALALAALAFGHGFSLRRGFQADRVRPGWIVGGWAIAAWQMTLGFAIGLPFFYLLALLGAIAVGGWFVAGRPRLPREIVWANAGGLVLFSVAVYLVARVYLRLSERYETYRSYGELHTFSPPWKGLFTPPASSWLWGDLFRSVRTDIMTNPFKGPDEVTWLPGFVVLACAVAGVFYSVYRVWWRLMIAGSAVALGALSLGTELHGGAVYMKVHRYVPGWDATRTPGRLMMWATLALLILAAGFVTKAAEWIGQLWEDREKRPSLRTRTWVTLAVAVPAALALVEGVQVPQLYDVPAAPPTIARAQDPMVIIPSEDRYDCVAMFWTVGHYKRVTNGCGSIMPPMSATIRDATRSFPSRASVQFYRSLGIRSVVVIKKDVARLGMGRVLARPIEGLPLTRYETSDAVVFTIQPARKAG